VVTQRLAQRAALLLDQRQSRRDLLGRIVLAASALTIGPVRYLTRPVSAWAVITRGDCGPNTSCNDGWTAFCCQINGGLNMCPEGTYVAGWWKCADYAGERLCAKEGVRYYVDCNRLPHRRFPGGCRCANNNCNQRSVDCNQFRYGQCNTQIVGTTEVACRVVVCQHPATIPGFHCNATLKEDNTTCTHDAPCLTDLVQQVPGEGGATSR
jgi:hypothetical protein